MATNGSLDFRIFQTANANVKNESKERCYALKDQFKENEESRFRLK